MTCRWTNGIHRNHCPVHKVLLGRVTYFLNIYNLYPIGSMYGICTYVYHKNQPNVGKYTIHGSFRYMYLRNKPTIIYHSEAMKPATFDGKKGPNGSKQNTSSCQGVIYLFLHQGEGCYTTTRGVLGCQKVVLVFKSFFRWGFWGVRVIYPRDKFNMAPKNGGFQKGRLLSPGLIFRWTDPPCLSWWT